MKRVLCVAAIVLCGLAGATMGFFSLDAKYWIYGPLAKSPRYSGGVGGAIRGLIEGAYAICVGGLVAARLGWLVCGAISIATLKHPTPGGRLVRLDFVLLGMVVLWLYLIYASW